MITKWIEFAVAAKDTEIFAAELSNMEQRSQSEEGCSVYSVYRSLDQAHAFTVLESWETTDHLERHRQSAHMARFKENCSAMILEKRALSLGALLSG